MVSFGNRWATRPEPRHSETSTDTPFHARREIDKLETFSGNDAASITSEIISIIRL
ncbi:hypothetical protein APY04_0024 [Hyphomicrobium sulfonivorans]|uniref:Uncharacterized protein n=1 Tax=Hyphomicrobium sulfonivorans TaxID=121290 RepID=A0A120CYS1_HYPSL|nr:hypothetical protein APY04_0024 [Hyphomicrobium sulfonivorans]